MKFVLVNSCEKGGDETDTIEKVEQSVLTSPVSTP